MAHTFVVNSNYHCGPIIFFFEPRGDNPDNTGVPASMRSPYQRAVEPATLRFRLCTGLNLSFDFTAIFVESVESFGECLRFVNICRCQQSSPKIGFSNTATRIDARSQQIAKMIGFRRAVQGGHIPQRYQTGAVATRHNGKPLAHQGAIKSDERGYVCHGAQRHQIKHIKQRRSIFSCVTHEPVHGNEG